MINHKGTLVHQEKGFILGSWHKMKGVVIEKLFTILNFFIINNSYTNVGGCSYAVISVVKSIRYKKSLFIVDKNGKVFVLKAIGGLGIFDLNSGKFGKMSPLFYKYISRELTDCQRSGGLRHISVPFAISLEPMTYSRWCYILDYSKNSPQKHDFLRIESFKPGNHITFNRSKRNLVDYTSPKTKIHCGEEFPSYDSELTGVLCHRLEGIYNNYIKDSVPLKYI